jgi:WD40 repeat protein
MLTPLRSLIIAGILPLLASCNLWPSGIDPEFVQTFIDVNRHNDDRPVTVAFDPKHRVLAVGRESGRLELWDAHKADHRLLLEAHSMRTEHVVFGSADGIVLTSSEIDGRAKVWDVRTGKLLHVIEGSAGPMAPTSKPGVYVLVHHSGLRLYNYATRAMISEPLDLEGTITALTADPASGLIAAGTAGGSLHVVQLEQAAEALKLTQLRTIKPYQAKDWIQVVALRDEGKRLISVSRLTCEVAEWDTTTFQRLRVLPTTLMHIGWGAVTPGEPWLVLGGTMVPGGFRHGKIELVDLRNGVALRYDARTNMPVAVLLPEISTGLILQTGSVRRIRYLE